MSSSEAALFRGDRLRRIRKKRALSQRELAEMVGWETGASVGHLERARRSEVPLARLRALAAALIVTPEWLLGEGADEDYDKDANGATEQSATIVPFQSDPDLDELVGLYLAMNPAERAALMSEFCLWTTQADFGECEESKASAKAVLEGLARVKALLR